MKLDEIPDAVDAEFEEEEEEGEEDGETVENLIEALCALSDVDNVLDTISDIRLNPRWDKTPKWLRHNLLKARKEVKDLLAQYPDALFTSDL